MAGPVSGSGTWLHWGNLSRSFFPITGKGAECSELNSLLPLMKTHYQEKKKTHYHSLRLKKLFLSSLAKASN